MPGDDLGSKPLFADQPEPDCGIDCILGLRSTEAEQWRFEDEALGREASNVVHHHRVGLGQSGRGRADAMNRTDTAMSTADKEFDRVAVKAVQTLEPSGTSARDVADTCDVGRGDPEALVPAGV